MFYQGPLTIPDSLHHSPRSRRSAASDSSAAMQSLCLRASFSYYMEGCMRVVWKNKLSV
jgi:hypothetical protein